MSLRRQRLNAVKHQVIGTVQAGGRWSAHYFSSSLSAWLWGLLRRWMKRVGFEFQTRDQPHSVNAFETCFKGVFRG